MTQMNADGGRISQAMRLLGWTQRQMSEAIEAGEVELWTTPLG